MITPATASGEIGQFVELLATVSPANATYQGVIGILVILRKLYMSVVVNSNYWLQEL
ncbi:tail fiber [Salmonella phage 38]|uniref:Tail fiber n=1 Tax=Salmonella phage 38 TaxID=1654891 RepID=A0A0N7CF04_9CAUD|nr:tail fiber [Salmonella phage 38]AKJ73857.1 tail fiber [Salmonella phage 38]